MSTQTFAAAEAWFLRERSEEPPAIAAPGEKEVTPRDCAGWWRRLAAWSIDAVVVTAIITSFGGQVLGHGGDAERGVSVAPGHVNISEPGVNVSIEGKKHVRMPSAPPSTPPVPAPEVTFGPFVFGNPGVELRVGGQDVPLSVDAIVSIIGEVIKRLGFAFWFPVYLAALVIVAGQTFGMMIAGLRVVTTNFSKPSIGRTIFRYLIAGFLFWLIVPLSLIWRRILLHDRWSKTRLVKVERVVARISGAS